MPSKKVSFTTDVNEGAFFHEPWLTDNTTGKSYRYDHIPPRVAKRLASEMLSGKHFDKHHVELLCDFITIRKR